MLLDIQLYFTHCHKSVMLAMLFPYFFCMRIIIWQFMVF